MNRLWVRLSLSFSLVLLLVLATPILLFWLAFISRAPARGMFVRDGHLDAALAAAMFTMLIIATLFSAFVGIIAGIWVSRGLGRQVTQLVTATEMITPANLEHRVEVQGVKELQDLAASFNRMVAELEWSMQARRDLLADVSHELLTPLTVLEGNLRAMLDGVYALNEEEVSFLYDQTHHLIALVKELRQLALADAQQLPLNMEETALNELVEETVTIFTPLAREVGVELHQVVYAQLPAVLVDPQHIRQVLGNLLANALRHTEQGGVVTIQTRASAGSVQLSVHDTGEGMSSEELSHTFDRYYRGEASRRRDISGAGLGLAIVRALVAAQGGTVAVASTPEKGTTFTVALPALEPSL